MQNKDGRPQEDFGLDETIYTELVIEKRSSDTNFLIGMTVNDISEKRIVIDHHTVNCTSEASLLKCRVRIPASLLTPHDYSIDLALIKQGSETLDIIKNILRFRIIKTNTKYEYLNYDYGYINQKFDWEIQALAFAGET